MESIYFCTYIRTSVFGHDVVPPVCPYFNNKGKIRAALVVAKKLCFPEKSKEKSTET